MYNYRVDPGYIKIENLAQYLVKIPSYHPEDPRYREFWSYETAKCVEGVWGRMFGGYRYMFGNLYFFANYTKLQDTDVLTKKTKDIKPFVWDLFWEWNYYMQEAKGFSGYEGDEEITCDLRYFEIYDQKLTNFSASELVALHHLFRPDGTIKQYVPAREYLRRIHKKPMGAPLHANPCQNFIVLGSRGGGKSYYFALAEFLYYLVFDGAKRYDNDFLNFKLKAETIIGAAETAKSADFCNKIDACIELMATDHELGAYGKPGEADYAPSPFYRDFSGSLKPNNKTAPMSYSYEVLEGGHKVVKGSGSAMYHVSYSVNKKDASESAAGGRYLLNGYEELGLMGNFIDALNSNEFTVSRNGVQIGVQVGFGTSGHIEKVQQARKVYQSPRSYKFLAIPDVWEGNGDDGNIGFFLPYAATIQRFKDINGNTNWDKAFDFIETRIEEAMKSSDPKRLRALKLHTPNVPSDMWASEEGYLLPYEEAVEREKQLTKNNLFKSLATPVTLRWDNQAPYGVSYDIETSKEFIYQHPIDPKKMLDPSGCVVIYEPPQFINGIIPPDLYNLIGHDPYVAEEIDKGGSLGVTYIVKNPKYLSQGVTGNIIVASYIGKPVEGLSKYYENQEKLLALYGNPIGGLWYESVRGEYCRSYYLKKHKMHLLCVAPQREQGSNIYQKNMVRTGFSVGNKISKLNLVTLFNDWLLEVLHLPQSDGSTRETKVIFEIPCLFLIAQIKDYNIDDNFDAVSAMLGCTLGLREFEHTIEDNLKNKERKKALHVLTTNSRLFNDLKIKTYEKGSIRR